MAGRRLPSVSSRAHTHGAAPLETCSLPSAESASGTPLPGPGRLLLLPPLTRESSSPRQAHPSTLAGTTGETAGYTLLQCPGAVVVRPFEPRNRALPWNQAQCLPWRPRHRQAGAGSHGALLPSLRDAARGSDRSFARHLQPELARGTFPALRRALALAMLRTRGTLGAKAMPRRPQAATGMWEHSEPADGEAGPETAASRPWAQPAAQPPRPARRWTQDQLPLPTQPPGLHHRPSPLALGCTRIDGAGGACRALAWMGDCRSRECIQRGRWAKQHSRALLRKGGGTKGLRLIQATSFPGKAGTHTHHGASPPRARESEQGSRVTKGQT